MSLGMTVYPSGPQFPRLLRVAWAKASKESALPTLAAKALLGPAISSGPVPTQREECHLLSPRLSPEHGTTKGICKFCNLPQEQLCLLSPFASPQSHPWHRAEGGLFQPGQGVLLHCPHCPLPTDPKKSREPPCHPAPTSGPGPGQPPAASPSHTGQRLEVQTMVPIVTKFPPEDLIQDVRVSDHKRN